MKFEKHAQICSKAYQFSKEMKFQITRYWRKCTVTNFISSFVENVDVGSEPPNNRADHLTSILAWEFHANEDPSWRAKFQIDLELEYTGSWRQQEFVIQLVYKVKVELIFFFISMTKRNKTAKHYDVTISKWKKKHCGFLC